MVDTRLPSQSRRFLLVVVVLLLVLLKRQDGAHLWRCLQPEGCLLLLATGNALNWSRWKRLSYKRVLVETKQTVVREAEAVIEELFRIQGQRRWPAKSIHPPAKGLSIIGSDRLA